MLRGGYILVDATGIDLASAESQSVTGIWVKARNAAYSGKPIVAEGLIYGSYPVTPVTAFAFIISSTEIAFISATLHIHIKSDDTVVVIDVAGS